MEQFKEWLNGGDSPVGYSPVGEGEKKTQSSDDYINDFFKTKKEIELTFHPKSSSPRFFHFGDWSSKGNLKNPVILRIVEDLKKKKYDFGIIAGDNFYSSDQKGGKLPNDQQMTIDHDFRIMNKLNIPLFAIFGKHDVSNCDIMKAEIDQTVMIYEKGLKIDLKNSNWILPYLYYSVICLNNQFLMLDTNLIDSNYDVLNCYKQLSYNPKDDMMAWFSEQISLKNRAVHHPIIVTHIPLLSFIDDKIHVIIDSVMLLKMAQSGKKYFTNLAGGVHNFQHLKFVASPTFSNIEIDIIVAGTGGGPPMAINPKVKALIGKETDITLSDGQHLGKLYLNKIDSPYGYASYGFDSFGKLNVDYIRLQDTQ